MSAHVTPLLTFALVVTLEGTVTQFPTIADAAAVLLGTFDAALSASCADAYTSLTTFDHCAHKPMSLPTLADAEIASVRAELQTVLALALRPLQHLTGDLNARYAALLRVAPADYVTAWSLKAPISVATLAEVQRLRQVCQVLLRIPSTACALAIHTPLCMANCAFAAYKLQALMF